MCWILHLPECEQELLRGLPSCYPDGLVDVGDGSGTDGELRPEHVHCVCRSHLTVVRLHVAPCSTGALLADEVASLPRPALCD